MVVPTPPIDEQSCGNCVMFRAAPDGVGTCHALPPRSLVDRGIGVSPLTVWPAVGVDDWCGTWEAIPPNQQGATEPDQPDESYDDDPADAPDRAPRAVVPHRKKSRR